MIGTWQILCFNIFKDNIGQVGVGLLSGNCQNTGWFIDYQNILVLVNDYQVLLYDERKIEQSE